VGLFGLVWWVRYDESNKRAGGRNQRSGSLRLGSTSQDKQGKRTRPKKGKGGGRKKKKKRIQMSNTTGKEANVDHSRSGGMLSLRDSQHCSHCSHQRSPVAPPLTIDPTPLDVSPVRDPSTYITFLIVDSGLACSTLGSQHSIDSRNGPWPEPRLQSFIPLLAFQRPWGGYATMDSAAPPAWPSCHVFVPSSPSWDKYADVEIGPGGYPTQSRQSVSRWWPEHGAGRRNRKDKRSWQILD
jgi:hypothetical protein